MHLLLSTLVFRWYVFLFWGVGLLALARVVGFSGALFRFLLGYVLAYGCEWSSSRSGGWFPFGHYRYLPTTASREIWVGPLPLMDSLSFSFLAVGALGMASLLTGKTLRETLLLPWRSFLKPLALSVVLFILIDMVIDPVALRGDRWFLGKIYDYPDGGAYFGVTLSNFLGWGVTGLLIMGLWKVLPVTASRYFQTLPDRLLPVFIYAAVFLFNFTVALLLKEWGIVGADLLLAGLIVLAALLIRRTPSFGRVKRTL